MAHRNHRQSPAGDLQAVFEFRHEGLAHQARGNRRQEFQGDGARFLAEAAPAPEETGIQRHGHDRQIEMAVERGHPRSDGGVRIDL